MFSPPLPVFAVPLGLVFLWKFEYNGSGCSAEDSLRGRRRDAGSPGSPRKERTKLPGSRVGGKRYAKAEVESEYDLHIRAAAGEPAAHLPLRHEHGGGAHGQVKDNGQINMALCCDFRCGTSYCVTSILSLALVVRCDSKNSTRS